MKRVFLILKEDIIDYPPVLTILNVLPRWGYQAIHIGVYSDLASKAHFEEAGVEFLPTIKYRGNANYIIKFIQQLQYRNQVKRYLRRETPSNNDIVWIMQAETICLLHKLIGKYRTVLHFFEFTESRINWKYKLLAPFYNPRTEIKKAYKIVCCEYNRSQIMKGLFQLDELPVVLPNKMCINDSALSNPPEDLLLLLNTVYDKLKKKTIILYQGIFLDKERRLEEFCEAVSQLPDDFVLVVMGRGNKMYDELKEKYESNRILFIPFIRPPYHLLVTRLATIGVLSYFPRAGNISRTINPLYCAPNKIFEYAKFHIPMISNDVPALKYTFLEYGCGECISYPMTSRKITETIQKIIGSLPAYQERASRFYESVDVERIIKEIVEPEP